MPAEGATIGFMTFIASTITRVSPAATRWPTAANGFAPGDRVEEGATLVIIEAMKVMNPITAPRAGVVRQLLVGNAQPVEYDQPLVILE